jgi:hypothetical protein
MPAPNASPLERPIVVVGAPRSGTTLLGQLLGAHPSLAHLEEPRLTWRYGNDEKGDWLVPSDARPEVCDYIRSKFAAAVHSNQKQRLIEKTPSNSLRMGFVEKVLPGCQFIHIIRDGVESSLAIRRFWGEHARGINRAKLLQRLKEIKPRQAPYYAREFIRRIMPAPLAGLVSQPVWGPRIPGIDALVKELDLIEVCALQWRTCVEAARHYGRTLPTERYLECRLEEMSADRLKSILDYCGLDDSPQVWEAFERNFDAGQTRHRRAAAEPGEIDQIMQWIEPTMRWLGYPLENRQLPSADG